MATNQEDQTMNPEHSQVDAHPEGGNSQSRSITISPRPGDTSDPVLMAQFKQKMTMSFQNDPAAWDRLVRVFLLQSMSNVVGTDIRQYNGSGWDTNPRPNMGMLTAFDTAQHIVAAGNHGEPWNLINENMFQESDGNNDHPPSGVSASGGGKYGQ
ncbi:hypothetical protein TREMEDRAFT_65099 [Tremella mesenterica DSM 1558]|uniref:uncharacterized protein n=1 Tax=Tremella mesenterica (strain ATCC 24925 / CBS 8224 / DSM 1558 / NBRC 9311 / NRRL Y-6157 / RJB 2259-6 / UBC 559-6) TaxID=578456 RepID=UPI00032CD3DC|nr:uncharacterized protein TREMEDRAFT_65099 [Tremella mesenterica DSM 1558]EIW66705.1 hypothetical protein TREMEDRAFT_65099 [Tremella mesenterica DSM 1558]